MPICGAIYLKVVFIPVKIFYELNRILLNLLNFMPEHKADVIMTVLWYRYNWLM